MYSSETASQSSRYISKYYFCFLILFRTSDNVYKCIKIDSLKDSLKKGIQKAIGLDQYSVQLQTSFSTYLETLECV